MSRDGWKQERDILESHFGAVSLICGTNGEVNARIDGVYLVGRIGKGRDYLPEHIWGMGKNEAGAVHELFSLLSNPPKGKTVLVKNPGGGLLYSYNRGGKVFEPGRVL